MNRPQNSPKIVLDGMFSTPYSHYHVCARAYVQRLIFRVLHCLPYLPLVCVRVSVTQLEFSPDKKGYKENYLENDQNSHYGR